AAGAGVDPNQNVVVTRPVVNEQPTDKGTPPPTPTEEPVANDQPPAEQPGVAHVLSVEELPDPATPTENAPTEGSQAQKKHHHHTQKSNEVATVTPKVTPAVAKIEPPRVEKVEKKDPPPPPPRGEKVEKKDPPPPPPPPRVEKKDPPP